MLHTAMVQLVAGRHGLLAEFISEAQQHTEGCVYMAQLAWPLTGAAMCCCRTYRGLYILNWIYRFMTEPNYRQWIVWVSGLVQTVLYLDFFYYYFLAWKNNKKLQLPA